MPAKQSTTMQTLRKFALKLPDTTEGVACAGTALESRTVRTRDKAFLFLRPTELRLKLGASLPDASKRAARDPDHFQAGTGGWVQVKFAGATDPIAVLQDWIAESHALYAAAKAPAAGARKKVRSARK
jgi:hypothetical protein